ncbi:OmpA family protein [Roseobacter sp.]|uniref:OmpA family protein n=1 Tax=Roseobacter sp. TaxID=1907202 RepID=UPI003299C5CD
MTARAMFLIAVLSWAAGGAWALDLALPSGGQMTVERATKLDSFDAPVGGFVDGAVPGLTLEGAVTRRAWRLGARGLTPLQVMAPLRDQIEALGYRVAFECGEASCGGFDFRFAVEVLPGPNMYVNIGAYRYLTAFKGPQDAPTEAVTVLASTTTASAYVQVIHAGTSVRPPVVVAPATQPAPSGNTQADPLVDGYLALYDLDFATGTTTLGPGPFATLARLAALLTDRPDLRIALVGHTDTVGGLAPNIGVSRARAQAVKSRLVDEYGINATRLDAEGVGYLAPLTTNATPDGRDRNRRVEAVVLGTQ